MRNNSFIFIFVTHLLLSASVWSASVFQNGDKLIVNDPRQSHIINMPEAIHKSSSYVITIHPHQSLSPSDFGQGAGYADVDLALFKANQLFRKHDLDGAMVILTDLYEQAPQNTKLNNMIGSIYFQLKDYEMARKFWSESLRINGNQPQVESFLRRLPTDVDSKEQLQ